MTTTRRFLIDHWMILFSMSDLVRMGACVGWFQFLEFQLVRALSDHALSGFDTGQNGHLCTIFVSDDNVTALKLFSGSQHVNDLLALVIDNGFSWNQKHLLLLARAYANVGLHADS